MSLKKATSNLKKIIDYTARFNQYTNPKNIINITMPDHILYSIFGFEDNEGETTTKSLAATIKDVGGDIMTGANIIRCASIMSLGDWGDFLGQLGMGVSGAIMAVLDPIVTAISIQLSNAVSQIASTVLNIVSALYDLWTQIGLIITALGELWDNWTTNWNLKFQWELDAKNCKDMFAAIGACFLNKFLGPYLTEFKEKAVREINNYGNDFNQMLYEEMKDINTFASYASQEAFLLQKAQLQMKGLTKENLLSNLS